MYVTCIRENRARVCKLKSSRKEHARLHVILRGEKTKNKLNIDIVASSCGLATDENSAAAVQEC